MPNCCPARTSEPTQFPPDRLPTRRGGHSLCLIQACKSDFCGALSQVLALNACRFLCQCLSLFTAHSVTGSSANGRSSLSVGDPGLSEIFAAGRWPVDSLALAADPIRVQCAVCLCGHLQACNSLSLPSFAGLRPCFPAAYSQRLVGGKTLWPVYRVLDCECAAIPLWSVVGCFRRFLETSEPGRPRELYQAYWTWSSVRPPSAINARSLGPVPWDLGPGFVAQDNAQPFPLGCYGLRRSLPLLLWAPSPGPPARSLPRGCTGSRAHEASRARETAGRSDQSSSSHRLVHLGGTRSVDPLSLANLSLLSLCSGIHLFRSLCARGEFPASWASTCMPMTPSRRSRHCPPTSPALSVDENNHVSAEQRISFTVPMPTLAPHRKLRLACGGFLNTAIVPVAMTKRAGRPPRSLSGRCFSSWAHSKFNAHQPGNLFQQ